MAAAQAGFPAGPRRRPATAPPACDRAADLLEAAPRPLHRAAAGARPARPSTTRSSEVREAVDFCRYYAAAGARPVRPGRAAARPDRREQPARPARPRRVRLHLPVEFPAGDLHRPGRRGAGRRQRRRRQARRADAADRRRRPCACSTRPACRRDALHSRARATARVGARAGRASRASPASPSPARPRPRARINRALAAKDGPIVPLIAETGGLNAMIVDTTALPEQVADDVVALRLPLGRPALLGAAPALRAGGRRRPDDRDDRRRRARAEGRRPARARRPISAR